MLSFYQLAFFTPGTLPSLASFLRHSRQTLNLRYTALALPQIWQRVYPLTRNFGFILALFTRAFVDITFCSTLRVIFYVLYYCCSSFEPPFAVLKGIPNSASILLASSSVLAVVAKVIFIPCWNSTLAVLISGKTVCSLSPIE
jgi:hypothetical protein